MFVGLNPKQSVSEMMQLVKGDSSEFVNKKNFTKKKFLWQAGYGAFTNSHSQISSVVKYILNQKAHHQRKPFIDEYIEMLENHKIDYDEKYLFHHLLD